MFKALLDTWTRKLLSGQKPISYEMSEERRSLAIRFILLMEENRILDILDERLVEQDREEQVIAVANLARKCLNLNWKESTDNERSRDRAGADSAVKRSSSCATK
ncbi:hypothetical protein DKX38_000275 [Salix brachista]|uniref:Uncharacterized protein n=1 Tax=Salix brachista TaxID=2182728 RepID=A0A5N5P2Q3_9ROSI|nr:hypothetical protein DKX38_000275 [Salix brachista]